MHSAGVVWQTHLDMKANACIVTRMLDRRALDARPGKKSCGTWKKILRTPRLSEIERITPQILASIGGLVEENIIAFTPFAVFYFRCGHIGRTSLDLPGKYDIVRGHSPIFRCKHEKSTISKSTVATPR